MRSMFATIKSVSDTGPGTFEAVASAPTIDRDSEIVAKGAFNPLPLRVPIHIDHRYSADSLVGSARPYYSGDNLMVSGNFASTPRAQEVRQLVLEGHLTHMSVGFRDTVRSKNADGVPVITRAELLEVSLVTVSSNREALVLAAKGSSATDMTVAEARRLVNQMMVELALSDLKEAGRALDRTAKRPNRPILSGRPGRAGADVAAFLSDNNLR